MNSIASLFNARGLIYEKTEHGWWQSLNERVQFYGFWNDYDMFFKRIHELFINLITIEVEKYEQTCLDEKFITVNDDLNRMIQYLSDGVIRSYTLNYDRLLQKICGIEFFEGFSENGTGKVVFDSKKVIEEQDNNSCYSLHGSIHYNFDVAGISINPDVNQKNSTPAKPNFIAGLNKSSRILDKPYSQLYNAFYRDCINADYIIIIGYSFPDIHINRAIIEGSDIKSNQKIFCVGYHHLGKEIDINFDNESEFDLFKLDSRGDFGKFMGGHHRLYEIATKENSDRIFYFREGLENFLKWEIWKKCFS